ncbi:hypothetical protein I7X12_18870 [Halosimplex litoreum]|uniref:Uncharacterized protein n=1 Tax=Halosimplex litoreum TaxID=1198301 RepID=A0A7T3KVE7_9EURY|nr:hypothetical protein [Halosimplex litoreum]QPV62760.1 hypothetical protein I7X12_18870 [Halosimplex litoreum]
MVRDKLSNPSRRRFLKRSSLGIAAGIPAARVATGSVAAEKWDELEPPYKDVKESIDDEVTITNEQDDLIYDHRNVSTTTVTVLNADEMDNGSGYTTTFGISTQALCLNDDDEKQDDISSHGFRIERANSFDGDMTIYTTDDSAVTGAWPNSGDELQNLAISTINQTAGVLNSYYAVALAGTTIVDKLPDASTDSCSERNDCANFEWSASNVGEVAHHSRVKIETTEEGFGAVLTSNVDNIAECKFALTSYEDNAFATPVNLSFN